jgi:hypothetical protein
VIHHVLTINELRFVLPDGEQVERIKRAVLAAVRKGGGFVELPTGPSSRVETLVTPASALSLEHIWVDDDNVSERDAEPHDGSSPYTGAIDMI